MGEKFIVVKVEYVLDEKDLPSFSSAVSPYIRDLRCSDGKNMYVSLNGKNCIVPESTKRRRNLIVSVIKDILRKNDCSTTILFKRLKRSTSVWFGERTFLRYMTNLVLLGEVEVHRGLNSRGGFVNIWSIKNGK